MTETKAQERLEDIVDPITETEDLPPKEETPQEPVVPEKYQGKSLEDIVHMHQEAEKLIGKQSSEVGELRKVVDSYIQSQLEAKEAPKETEVSDIDFFDNPREAVNRLVNSHPKIQQAEQQTNEFRRQAVHAQIEQKYPNLKEIVGDPAFAEWVNGSRIRTQLFQQADQQYDFDAADELLTTWTERQTLATKAVEMEKASRKSEVSKASTGSGSSSGDVSSKTYRRADIIKLMKTDPDRYLSLADEITRAYAEGRVR